MSKNCFGTRRIFNVEQIVTKENNTMTKYDQGEYEWLTYEDVNTISRNFSKGLRHLKFLPKDKILLYAESSAKWLVSAFGCFKNSMTVVTIYTNLGDEELLKICSKGFKKILASKGGLIQTIIYLEKEEFSLAQTTPEQDVNVYSFNEILEKGLKSYSQNDNEEDWRPNSEDIAVIMYTSGSSGVPKGVVLSHFNIMSNIFGIMSFLNQNFVRLDKESYIGYLPLAHIFELSVEIALFGKGIPIGFSGPNTLMNSGSMVKEGQLGDICELKPTYMAVVPLIADRIYKIIIQKGIRKWSISELLFNFCYEYKSKWRKLGMNTPIINLLFFKKIQQFLGGNVSTIVSGGAPLSAQAHEFMEIVFDLKLSQGYGLTETCGGFILGRKEDFSLGEVGHPFPGPFVKLTNWDEGEYTVKDKPYPRGEIHVGGGLIAMGYFELMDETEENFYEENGVRWFKTGDIGQLQSSGALKIIDRKKDIIKLQNGEYVSLGKVETYLGTHPLVDIICVYGEPERNCIVGLIIPNEKSIKILKESLGLRNESVYDNNLLRSQVRQALANHSEAKLLKFEIPKAVWLIHGPWTAENGLITTSYKLKRKAIQNKYQEKINIMYNEINGEVY
ncbi:LOW QUALITY PROTEIN: long-chain-fatty-acid--CoA ligase 4-like [Lepeophtheirus salmonis]|uniref:LOW QUALITY PROTEIN: long-chain-fatty-acid--CoA ligase 4-like n=1 Tax=Lepeophtheirus salmonis TaxID=72036 RepID=UPI003AF33A7B